MTDVFVKNIWIALAATLLWCAGGAHAADWNKDFGHLRSLRDKKQLKACLEKGEAMLKTYADEKNKLREIYVHMADCARRVKKWDEAIKVYEQMKEALAADIGFVHQALRARAETIRDANRHDEALAAFQALIDDYPDAKGLSGYAQLQRGYIHKDRTQKYDLAIAEFEKVATFEPENVDSLTKAWIGMADCYRALKDEAKAFPLYRRVILEHLDSQPHWVMRHVKHHVVESAMAAKAYKEGIACFKKAEEAEKDRNYKSRYAVYIAHALREDSQVDAALAAYLCAQADYPDNPDYLFDCQKYIVALRIEKAEKDRALSEARLLFDLAADDKRIVEACGVMAQCMKASDGNLERANQLLRFQKYGPAKAGVENPLLKIAYPKDAARTSELQAHFDQTGDSDTAARRRGYLLVLMGRAKDAIASFREAFALCHQDAMQNAARDLVLVGAKAVQGHATGLGVYYEWLNHGAGGAKGDAKNADPFKALLK